MRGPCVHTLWNDASAHRQSAAFKLSCNSGLAPARRMSRGAARLPVGGGRREEGVVLRIKRHRSDRAARRVAATKARRHKVRAQGREWLAAYTRGCTRAHK
eukprot:360570-Pleurochrysis_carterae.AAC.4